METRLGIIDCDDVAALGDEALLVSLRELLAKERGLSARLLLHLGEMDARGLYREQAFGSMFEYCVQGLQLSEAEAYLRIRAARVGRHFPRVLEMMAEGELHLSAVTLLAPVLTEANVEELLDRTRCKSKREVELVLAQRFEKPDVSSSIRALPQQRLAPERASEPSAEPQPEPLFVGAACDSGASVGTEAFEKVPSAAAQALAGCSSCIMKSPSVAAGRLRSRTFGCSAMRTTGSWPSAIMGGRSCGSGSSGSAAREGGRPAEGPVATRWAPARSSRPGLFLCQIRLLRPRT